MSTANEPASSDALAGGTLTARSAEPVGERDLGSVGEVPIGEGRLFDVDGWQVAVFRPRQGGVYAIDPVCPHRAGPLAEGLIGGTLLVCPLHGWTFDLVSGSRVGGDEAVACHPARVEDGQILVTGPIGPASEDPDLRLLSPPSGSTA